MTKSTFFASVLVVALLNGCEEASTSAGPGSSQEKTQQELASGIVGTWTGASSPHSDVAGSGSVDRRSLLSFGADGSFLSYDTVPVDSRFTVYKSVGTWAYRGSDSLALDLTGSFSSSDTGKTWKTRSPDGPGVVKFSLASQGLVLTLPTLILTLARVN